MAPFLTYCWTTLTSPSLKITTRKWKDEQSGQDKYSTEILIQGYNSSLTMLGGGNQNSIPSQDNKQSFDDSSMAQNELDDDIPF